MAEWLDLRSDRSVTRVGLTAQQLMNVQVDQWGSKSMETSKPISELFA